MNEHFNIIIIVIVILLSSHHIGTLTYNVAVLPLCLLRWLLVLYYTYQHLLTAELITL